MTPPEAEPWPAAGDEVGRDGTPPPAEVVDRFAQATPATSGLGNLGRLPIESQAGPLEIETLHIAPSPSGLGDLSFSATSFAGRLHLNAMWPEPSMDEPQARAIADDVVARLQAAVGCSA